MIDKFPWETKHLKKEEPKSMLPLKPEIKTEEFEFEVTLKITSTNVDWENAEKRVRALLRDGLSDSRLNNRRMKLELVKLLPRK